MRKKKTTGSQAWRKSYAWRKARKECIADQPYCDICGEPEHLDVHHVRDASYHPELRYVQSNLKTMCHKCHFTMMHMLYKGSTRKKTTKADYRRFKALVKYYMKKGKQLAEES